MKDEGNIYKTDTSGFFLEQFDFFSLAHVLVLSSALSEVRIGGRRRGKRGGVGLGTEHKEEEELGLIDYLLPLSTFKSHSFLCIILASFPISFLNSSACNPQTLEPYILCSFY